MHSRLAWLLMFLALIGTGMDSLANAQEPPQVINTELVLLNDDVSCVDCPPSEQTWELRITYRLSATCTQVDTYHSACASGCAYTYVGSTPSGSCGPASAPVANVEVSAPMEDDYTTGNHYYRKITIHQQYEDCYSVSVFTCNNCDPVCSCVLNFTELVGWCPYSTTSARPSRETPRAGTPTSLSLSLASRNPTSEPLSFRVGVPEASRGAREDLVLFDLFGRRVRGLRSGAAQPGWQNHRWDLRTDQGTRARAGMYYARYRLGQETRQLTVVILK